MSVILNHQFNVVESEMLLVGFTLIIELNADTEMRFLDISFIT
jgi:hypothetical protein